MLATSSPRECNMANIIGYPKHVYAYGLQAWLYEHSRGIPSSLHEREAAVRVSGGQRRAGLRLIVVGPGVILFRKVAISSDDL